LLASLFQLGRDVLGVEAPMTRFIVALELGVFALCILSDPKGFFQSFFGGGLLHGLFSNFRASTLIRFGALGGPLAEIEPWRMLSAVFVHMGILHVGMNLYTFVDLGRVLERALGGARFAILFVLAGFLGFLASETWYGFYGPVTAGASGGVFGQIGAVVGILYARRDPEWKRALVRYLFFAVLLGLALPVNTPAHLGGFFAGILLGFLLYKELTRLHLHRIMLVFAGICLLASVASVALSANSFAWQSVRAGELQRE
jgi:rhomboid protease GluP